VPTVVTGWLITEGSGRYQQGIENLVTPYEYLSYGRDFMEKLWDRNTIKCRNAAVSDESKEPKIYAL
jgi:hypothetical protein